MAANRVKTGNLLPPRTQFTDGNGNLTRPAQMFLNNLAGIASPPTLWNSPLVSSAGVNPATTAADIVLAVYEIPAGAFSENTSTLYAWAAGTFAHNANTKQAKIVFNPASAVVGQAVGSGGSVIIDTGAYSVNAAVAWLIEAQVIKYGANGSNTQIAVALNVLIGGASYGAGAGSAIQTITAKESAPILIALTGNASTTATDIAANVFQIFGPN
jgi:hypothetical protein